MNIKVTAEATVEFDSDAYISIQRIFSGAPVEGYRYRLQVKAEGIDRDEAEALMRGALFTLAGKLPDLAATDPEAVWDATLMDGLDDADTEGETA